MKILKHLSLELGTPKVKEHFISYVCFLAMLYKRTVDNRLQYKIREADSLVHTH